MTRFVFQCLSVALLLILAVTGYMEYFDLHPYYEQLLSNGKNRGLVLWALVGSLIPVLTLYFSKSFSFKKFFASLLAGVVFYGVCLVAIRGGLYGLGLILLARNSFVLIGLGVLQTGIAVAVGDAVKQYVLPDESWNRSRVGIALTMGLAVQLIGVYLLMILGLLYPVISWILLIGGGVVLWKSRHQLQQIGGLIYDGLLSIKTRIQSVDGVTRLGGWLLVILLVISFWYILNGFELSFMPYTTAWDANHAYMFFPKMWALNNGLYRGESGLSQFPSLWYAFITFWFSLFGWSDGIGWISVDTIALSLNFWSGIYVLILGVILVDTFLGHKKRSFLGFVTGWALILLRLTSGMGAFLVFVDNKTDLGVLTLIIGALLTGFAVLHTLKGNKISRQERNGLIVSGVLYGVAALAKVTAMFDVINFLMYLWGMILGSLGIIMIALLVAGLLIFIEFRGIKEYFPASRGPVLVGVGGIFGAGSFIQTGLRTLRFGLYVIMIWGIAFVSTMIVVKAPYLIGKVVIQDRNPSGGDVLRTIFLSKNTVPKTLLAQSNRQQLAATCSLEGQGFTDAQALYEGLQDAPGSSYNEDNVRYKGFGRKGNPSDRRRGVDPFVGTRWTGLVPDGCSVVSLNYRNELRTLCENSSALRDFDQSTILALSKDIDSSTRLSDLLDQIAQEIESSTSSADELKSRVNPQLQELLVGIEANTLYKDPETQEVFLPYKWIIPFNVSYNRSLQNLSSYYTDIGIFWLICFLFSFVGIGYGLVAGKKRVLISSSVTLTAWLLWMFVASGIVRYSIGLIVWSILSFILFVTSLFGHRDEDERPLQHMMRIIFLCLLVGTISIQLILNMIRIASQGGNGAFMRYKASVGKTVIFDETLQATNKTVTGFDKQMVFDLQFPHYTPFIDAMNARDDDEGGLIAGTYIRYFVNDQSHIKNDNFLTWLREQFSDNDVCNSYLRLQDQNIRYMAIDLNIGTVVQGEGNRSLFDRFFARVNTATNTIEDEGVISMLINLSQQGYVRYVSSNNLGAKYAYTIPDSAFQGLEGDALRLFKARMSVMRYFTSDTQMLQSVVQIAQQRIQDGMFVTDLADMMGLQIREDVLVDLTRRPQLSQEDIQSLTQPERRALSQYLSFRTLLQNDPQQLATQLQNTIRGSITNPNQILTLEVVE